MKSRVDDWLFATAMLAIAATLFVPVSLADASFTFSAKVREIPFISVLSWLAAAAAFWGFKGRFWPRDPREIRQFNNCVLLVVLHASLLRVIYECARVYGGELWPWMPREAWMWVPWFLIPGLAGMLLGGRYAVLVCLVSALMLYLLSDPGPWPLIGCVAASLFGILLLRRSPTRKRVLRAGTVSGGTLGIVGATHKILEGAPVDAVSAAGLVPLVIGFSAGVLVLAVLPVLEWILGELSDVTVIEYGNDHILLDELRASAPGTWHHSLNVADLAEKAAASIGAKSLFCKTTALYHDVGKLKDPAFFAENNAGPSPHDELEPVVSAEKIIGHVAYGLELARKHKLPRAFRDIIAEHHGTTTVRYFYAKACQPRPDGSLPNIDRAAFSYPGPLPSTRESGIVALADGIEAASRSFVASSEAELRQFVGKFISERMMDGQLADCPLTMSELAKVETAFVSWLTGRNHRRPAYPVESASAAALNPPAPRAATESPHAAVQPG